MENGAQEAGMIVRVTLDGASRLIRIATDMPRAAMEMVRILQAVQNGPTEGQVNLRKMMETGSALKVLPIKGDENFAKFEAGAKEYGIMYSVVQDTSNGIYDIMIREEDAPRVNRIIERYEMMPEDSLTVQAKEVRNVMSANRGEQNESFANKNGANNMDLRNPNLAPDASQYGARFQRSETSQAINGYQNNMGIQNVQYRQNENVNMRTQNVHQNVHQNVQQSIQRSAHEPDNIIDFSEISSRGTAPSKRNSVKNVIKYEQKQELLAAAEKAPEYTMQQPLPMMRPSDAFEDDILEKKKKLEKSLENFNSEFKNANIIQGMEFDKR